MLIFLACQVVAAGIEPEDYELLSIAMVSEQGEDEIYLERTDVKNTPYDNLPLRKKDLTGRPEQRCTLAEMATRVHAWIESLPGSRLTIAHDCPIETYLLFGLLNSLPVQKTIELRTPDDRAYSARLRLIMDLFERLLRLKYYNALTQVRAMRAAYAEDTRLVLGGGGH